MNLSALLASLRDISPKRYASMMVGNILMPLGIAIFEWSGAGNASYPALNLTLTYHVPLTYGTVVLILNTLFFLLQIRFGKHYIQVGTLVNWVIFGYIADFWRFLFSHVTYPGGWGPFVLCVLVGMLLFTFGIALYQCADVGIGPFDALSLMLRDYTHLPFTVCRLSMDLLMLLLCLLFGGWGLHQIGVVTVLSAFGIAPMVSFFNKGIQPWISSGKESVKA